MPFEVFPIKGIVTGGLPNGTSNRTQEVVRLEIESYYEDVASRFGEVIAGHVLDVKTRAGSTQIDGRGVSDRAYTGENVLFLVAKFPEPEDRQATL